MNKLRVALLIDADNLSGDVIGQAVEHLLKTFGAVHFRRAYSSPQKVGDHLELFKRHSIRPMVNVPTGKNSTDIALAVDAIDLAITERPDIVVIASSDSDYAPLAQRLREKGCRVLGIGQRGKTGGEAPLAYDEFIDLEHRKSPPAPSSRDDAPARATPRSASVQPSRPPERAIAPPPTAPEPARKAVAAKSPVARQQRARAAEPAALPSRAPAVSRVPSEIAEILRAVPRLASGDAVQLNELGEALRRSELLASKSASPSRLFKRHAAYFELLPADRPRTVRYLGS